jgi:hypothetical protein
MVTAQSLSQSPGKSFQFFLVHDASPPHQYSAWKRSPQAANHPFIVDRRHNFDESM